MRIVRTTLLLVIISTAGCYKWVPTDRTQLPLGTDVRLRVTDVGGDDIRRRVGEFDGTVTGPVAAWNGQRVSILTETTLRRQGFPSTTVSDTIPVPVMHIAGIDVKELDTKKSMLFAGGAVLVTAGLVLATRTFSGESGPDDGSGPPSDNYLITIPFSFGFGR